MLAKHDKSTQGHLDISAQGGLETAYSVMKRWKIAETHVNVAVGFCLLRKGDYISVCKLGNSLIDNDALTKKIQCECKFRHRCELAPRTKWYLWWMKGHWNRVSPSTEILSHE